jgi:hypothetical protein
MEQIFTSLILLAAMVFLGVMQWRQQSYHFKVQKNLMDRLMSRNFETYVQGQVAQRPAPGYLSEDELFQKEALAQAEKGIPVD